MGPVRGKTRKRKDKNLTEKKKKNKKNGCANTNTPSLDWWHDFSRMLTEGQLPPSQTLDNFELVFRMSRTTFTYICSLVAEDLTSKFTFLDGRLLSLHDQVAVALRRLGSGDSLVTVADSLGVNHSTVSQVTWRFVESMEQRALRHLEWPASTEPIKSKFEIMQGLPNCCGVVDITHITMLLSSSDAMADVWMDRDKNHSMVLQAIVSPNMRFLDIVTGWPGKMDESAVFQSSTFRKLCDEGERLNGEKRKIDEDGFEIGEYIIGDSGYPLMPNLIVPYEKECEKEMSEEREEFNRRHKGTCVVAQRAFARLKEMWKIIGGIMWRPDRHKLPRFILVCCLLHNIGIDMEDEVQAALPLSDEHDPGYKQRSCGLVDGEGKEMRDKLALYVSRRTVHNLAIKQ